MKSSIALSFALMGSMMLAGCGEKTATISYTIEYGPGVEALLANGKLTTVRFFYTWSELAGRAFVRPIEASPTVIRKKDGNAETEIRNWARAGAGGFQLGDGTSLSLKGFPVGKRGVQIGIELLQPGADGQNRVVAFQCIAVQPPTEPWTLARMRTDTAEPVELILGRSCGNCSDAQPGADPETNCANANISD